MDDWLILQSFYDGLTQTTCDYVDAAAGAFFSLTHERAPSIIIKKMVSNQSWSDDDSNHVSGACKLSRKMACSLQKLISSSKILRVIPKTRLKRGHFKPRMLV